MATTDDASLEVPRATGHASNGSIDAIHLDVGTATSAAVDVGNLAVHDAGEPASTEIEPVRDEDNSLNEDRLNEGDLARLTVELATPMEGGEERTLVVDHGEGETSRILVEAPSALDDGYHRLALR